jgi:peroxiredoxin
MREAGRIAEGDTLPTLRLKLFRDEHWQEVSSDDLFGGRRVIVFGLPGAFTPTCSTQHLPRYEELAPAFLARGIDEIVCASVNDSYVMEAWARDEGAQYVTVLADGNGEFTAALGMLVELTDESIPEAVHGSNELRLRRVVVESAADFGDEARDVRIEHER